MAPSRVLGVRIDSATWRTNAHTVDLGAETTLDLRIRLRVTQRTWLDSIAALYEFEDPRTGQVSYRFDDNILPSTHFLMHQLIVNEGSAFWADWRMRLEDGFATSRKLNSPCPRTVRIVPRNDLLRYLMPTVLSPSSVAIMLQQPAARIDAAGSPLVFVLDTFVVAEPFGNVVLGVAVNTADTALGPMVAALVIDEGRPIVPDGTVLPESLRTRDTLEYLIGRVGARDTVVFAGNRMLFGERVVDRLTYLASSIRDRRIAGEGDRHWVSWARYRAPDPDTEVTIPLQAE